jgi:hypothetical protein
MKRIDSVLTSLGIKFSKEEGAKVATYHFTDSYGQDVYMRQFASHYSLFHNKGKDVQTVTFKDQYTPSFKEIMVDALNQERLSLGSWVVC